MLISVAWTDAGPRLIYNHPAAKHPLPSFLAHLYAKKKTSSRYLYELLFSSIR